MGLNLNLSLLLQNKKTPAYHYLTSKHRRPAECLRAGFTVSN
jgi:hypothetical protein